MAKMAEREPESETQPSRVRERKRDKAKRKYANLSKVRKCDPSFLGRGREVAKIVSNPMKVDDVREVGTPM